MVYTKYKNAKGKVNGILLVFFILFIRSTISHDRFIIFSTKGKIFGCLDGNSLFRVLLKFSRVLFHHHCDNRNGYNCGVPDINTVNYETPLVNCVGLIKGKS